MDDLNLNERSHYLNALSHLDPIIVTLYQYHNYFVSTTLWPGQNGRYFVDDIDNK